MVERRDHVFTTFFSFREFIASTFSCKWRSTNGPFFSERAISLLFLHPAQLHPLRAARFPESPHRSRDAVRERAEGTYKARPLRVRNFVNNHRPARLAQTELDLRRRRESGRQLSYRLRAWLYDPPRNRFPSAGGSSCNCTSRRSHGCHRGTLYPPPRRVHFPLRFPYIPTTHPTSQNLLARRVAQLVTACAVRQSAGRLDASSASWRPEWEIPTVSEGDSPSRVLRRRHAGDPPGSSPRRERSACARATVCGLPCRRSHSRGPSSLAGRP